MIEERQLPPALQQLTNKQTLWWRKCDVGAFGHEGDGPMRDLIEIAPTINELVDKKRVAIQAGGNCGMYSSYLQTMFNAVYTFEPHPLNYECLKLNAADNCNHYPYALGDIDGHCHLNDTDDKNVGCYTVDHQSGDTRMVTIDSFNLTNVDLIMLDVEGFEQYVIKGALSTVERCKPVVIMEDLNSKARSLLQDLGYSRHSKCHSDSIYIPVAIP